jgi:hypothetical protein
VLSDRNPAAKCMFSFGHALRLPTPSYGQDAILADAVQDPWLALATIKAVVDVEPVVAMAQSLRGTIATTEKRFDHSHIIRGHEAPSISHALRSVTVGLAPGESYDASGHS